MLCKVFTDLDKAVCAGDPEVHVIVYRPAGRSGENVPVFGVYALICRPKCLRYAALNIVFSLINQMFSRFRDRAPARRNRSREIGRFCCVHILNRPNFQTGNHIISMIRDNPQLVFLPGDSARDVETFLTIGGVGKCCRTPGNLERVREKRIGVAGRGRIRSCFVCVVCQGTDVPPDSGIHLTFGVLVSLKNDSISRCAILKVPREGLVGWRCGSVAVFRDLDPPFIG